VGRTSALTPSPRGHRSDLGPILIPAASATLPVRSRTLPACWCMGCRRGVSCPTRRRTPAQGSHGHGPGEPRAGYKEEVEEVGSCGGKHARAAPTHPKTRCVRESEYHLPFRPDHSWDPCHTRIPGRPSRVIARSASQPSGRSRSSILMTRRLGHDQELGGVL
jgi:hypothetical protein